MIVGWDAGEDLLMEYALPRINKTFGKSRMIVDVLGSHNLYSLIPSENPKKTL